VKQKLGAAFKLDDGTGDILVALTSTAGAQDLAAGNYALVVGKLTSSGAAKQLHIKAHKVHVPAGLFPVLLCCLSMSSVFVRIGYSAQSLLPGR
jgi:hypothetical protein